MKRKKLCYAYDREADVMYFYFDRPRKAKTIELNDDSASPRPKNSRTCGHDGRLLLTTFPIPPRAIPEKGELETREVMKALLAA